MTNVLTIAGRELKAYFLSPLAWIIIALFAAFTGFIFSVVLVRDRVASMEATFQTQVFVLVFLTPALTMRLFSEEYKLGTMELLLTAPAREWQIVVGKFLAAWLGFVALLTPTLWYVLILVRFGEPNYIILGSSYLGVLLVGAAFVSIGMFASSLTQNQFVAFVLCVIFLLFLWIAGAPANGLGQANWLADFFRHLALPIHFQEFFKGILDTEHLLYFSSLTVIGIGLTVLVVSSRRWR